MGDPGTDGRAAGRVRRWAGAAAATVAVLASGLAAPAHACGCGAMIGETEVAGESAVVRFDGDRETILMRLDVVSEEPGAALVLPTPAPAEAELGDAAAFTSLAEVSAPVTEYYDDWWGGPWGFPLGAGSAPDGAGAGVDVLGTEKLGPFEVATLAADDSGALADWLAEHGYELPGDLGKALRPYVEEGWYYVAVKLASEDGRAALSGELDPVQVSFDSDELVYPMRLTALADTPQDVRLYLLAEHRMERSDGAARAVPSEVAFAGRVAPGDFAADDPAAELVGRDGAFLTTLDHAIDDPERVSADFAFTPSAEDTPYQEVRHEPRYVQILFLPAGVVLLGAALVVLLAGTLVLYRVRERRAVARYARRG
ncbi:hypothetical protein CLV63_104297 [Murinocardiopsis flavida]|uniref:DUF2330 domain-containing protein n=1 Tax=Murinocardiopsis flavida TaxID=645275 RepID=A0A2P8DPF3_9ACTN|nr:DUF2330 domain-containing protein [Murinocardiopsis flavida]PSK99073.1 hypothetical protein CLV63_104297 [Murinocardiopsis flavida]